MKLGQMTPKQVVTVSRQWDNPEIKAFMDDEQVGASIGLYDFVSAMVHVMGNPALILTRKQLEEKMFESAGKVLEEVKRATNYL